MGVYQSRIECMWLPAQSGKTRKCMERIVEMENREKELQTLIDLHNYAAMALMELESEPSVSVSLNVASASQTQSLPSIQLEQSRTRRSISDPPFKNSDAYDECNHRNINLR